MAFLTGAEALVTAGENAKAADMCKRALGEDSTCPAVYFKLAQIQEQLRQSKDAFKNYQTAAELAKKEKDNALASKAQAAAEKLGGGAVALTAADNKLIDKLLPLADEALENEQLETARSAYASIVALKPTHEKAKEGLDKAEKALAARGDPIKARLAGAMLAEVFYDVGIGKFDDATKMAQDIVSKHGGTAAAKEAEQLLANNFAPPKNIDAQVAEAKKQLKEQAAKAKKATATKPPPSSGSVSTAPVVVQAPAVDVDAIEKTATEDAKKVAKAGLVQALKDTFAKGKEFYKNATPGSEGNQKNVASALEEFIRCEQLFLRIDAEKLITPEVSTLEKQASMLRYACMKMTILSH